MAAVTEDLTAIREAVTDFAFARVTATGRPARAFVSVIEAVDGMIDFWDGLEEPTPNDYFRLGQLVGSLGNMAACRVDGSGQLIPMAVVYPDDDPVGIAASGMRDAVLSFSQPTD